MDKFGLIGCPISHSPSPALFKTAYAGKWQYDLIESQDFEECWSAFAEGYKGINVTIPFKEAVMSRVDVVHPECIAVGAANIVVKTARGLEAHNSDYLAVESILKELCPDGGKALVVGFGGAGKAAAAAARSLGMDVTICNRSLDRAEGLRPLGELKTHAETADVMVYTLPCPVPEIEGLRCRRIIEANYRTPALEGCDGVEIYVPGTEWLTRQAELGYVFLTGKAPDVAALRSFFK